LHRVQDQEAFMRADKLWKNIALAPAALLAFGSGGCGSQSESTGASSAGVSATLGCFADEMTRDLPDEAASGGSMSVEICLIDCAHAGYAYAGVQYGNQCFCGNSYGKYGTATDCNMKCSANSGETCGGVYANSIYKVPASPPPSLGCYKDESTRDLPDQTSLSPVSAETCINTCKQAGYSYAGVQYGSQCFCGNGYGRYGTATDCNMTCNGDSAETCGGTWANNVYATGTTGSYSCPGGVKCDGTPITGSPNQEICGTDLHNWVCTSSGWQDTGTTCTCGDGGGGGGSGTCSPTASGPGGAGAANVAGSNMPAFPKLSNPFTVTGLDASGNSDVGSIIQQALSSHSQIIIPGSGNFGSPHRYKVVTPVNVPDGAIIECQQGAQFLDPTDCLGDMPGLFWWSNETASAAGAGMYGCMFKGTASGSNYQTSYNHAFIRLQSGHNFTIEGNITTNSCGDADIRLDGPENSSTDHGSTGNTIAFNNTNYAENGIAIINAWNNTVMCNAFNGGGIDEEPNHSYPQVGQNTFTLNYTQGAGISIGGNGTSCPSGSGVCARDFVTKNVIVGPGPVYCECNAAGTACDNDSFGGKWSGNIVAGGAICKCGGGCTQ
jgi:hypothetical protein